MDDQLQGAALPRVRWAAAGRAGLAVVLAVSLGGCAGASSPSPTTAVSSAAGQAPSAPPESTPEPSPSGEPSPVAEPDPEPEPEPTRSDDRSELLIQPDDMAKTGRAGAIAAAKYYMGLFEYVHLTGDLEMWTQMRRPGCEYCDVVVEGVGEMHQAGQYRVSGPPKFRGKPRVEYLDYLDLWEVTLRARISGSTTYDSAGKIVASNKGGVSKITFGVQHAHGSWGVTGIVVERD